MRTDISAETLDIKKQDVSYCTSSALTLRARFENYSRSKYITQNLRKIINSFPLLLDLNVCIHLQGDYCSEFYQELSFLLEELQSLRFGASKKVPAVYLFSPVLFNNEAFFRILNEYNTIDDCIHLVSVIEEDNFNTNLIEEQIHKNKTIADSYFINNQVLFSFDFFQSYSPFMEFIKKIKCKYFYNSFTYCVYLQNNSQNNKHQYQNILEIFKLPQFSLDYIPYLPPGLMDIIFCAEKILGNKAVSAKEYQVVFHSLVNANNLFRHNCYCFNNKKLIFERESTCIDIELLSFLTENISAIRDAKIQGKTRVKVRAAMIDFVNNKEIC